MRVSVVDLTGFAARLLRSAGVPKADADVTAERLVGADARGRTGHGLIRLVPYLDRIRAGGINVAPEIRVLSDRPSSAQVDGDNGLGQVVVTRATDLAVEKAAHTGVGVVGTVRSNHAGAAGLYALRAAEAGMVGIYLAVANANGMPPWGGRNPLLGTNPLAIAVPAGHGATPFLLDIATTAASHGTIKTTRAAGLPMPEGWVVDREGRPITDPALADEGFLVPMGGYKGAGLTIAIGLLAGVLNGAAFGSAVVDHRLDLTTPTNTGQLLVVLGADLFRPMTDALGGVTAALSELRRSDGPGTDDLRLPGDRSAELWAAAVSDGLDLPASLWDQLTTEATRAGVALPV
jgi:L-2-hydroxycarboxylate dehydrogenase (NAD+)